MAAPGPFGHSRLGPEATQYYVASAGVSTNPMAASDAGWCARFMAMDARDIKTVYLNFSVVTAPGQIEVRIETVNAANGKPTGTLYDANAAVTITPASGWNACTFATLPTTGLTAGTEYAIVVITTSAGTTMTMRSHVAQVISAQVPAILLLATGASTRTNFGESNSSVPVCTIVYEDDVEEDWGMIAMPTAGTFDVYGTRSWGMLFTVPANLSVKIVGAAPIYYTFAGSPGNIRCRIFDSGFSLVTGAACTVDKDSVTVSGKRMLFRFPETTLSAGTYRILIDQTDHSTISSNKFSFYSFAARGAALIPASMNLCTTTNIDAGPPPTFTDDAASIPGMELIVNDLASAGGGGSAFLNRGILTGGGL